MSSENETRVFYRAMADFTAIRRELASYRRSLATTKAAEQAFNASGAKDRAAATKAATARSKAATEEAKGLKASTSQMRLYNAASAKKTVAVRVATKAIQAQNRALLTNARRLTEAATAAKGYAAGQKKISSAVGPTNATVKTLQKEVTALKQATEAQEAKTRAQKEDIAATHAASKANVEFIEDVGEVNKATGEVVKGVDRKANSFRRAGLAAQEWRKRMVRFVPEGGKLRRAMSQTEGGLSRLLRGFERFGNWRPRLVPPFVALIPLIGAVIAAINPLVAIIGTLGPLTLGLASNIGSLSGAFLALPGILGAVVAGISSVIAAMGGLGGVFKAYSAMKEATSGSGRSQEERAEALADAEYNLAKAQKTVKDAQEDLNDARKEALEDLVALRLEVSRAQMNEERAIANLRLAKEAYWDTMADPASTEGDKLAAAAAVKEAEADLADVRDQAKKDQEALTEAEKKGVEGSDKVVEAQERLTEAYRAQKKAQDQLKDEKAGGAGSTEAIQKYEEALAKLSPSAQKFVLAILAMEDQWKSFKKTIQEDFFSQFSGDLGRLPRILKSIESFLRPAARAMGDFVSGLLELLDSPAWRSDMVFLGEQNGRVLKDLGDGFLALIDMFKDIAVAAGPFTEFMTNGFARGSENLRDFVANARETGSLARWLETVETRMRKWWEIIKNIGSTLFNYSAAASEFGDWISDNLLEMTAGWAESAKAAREDGSPFQQWLEDIKPLLGEVNGLFGDFFGWFRETVMDPENIEGAERLIEVIREDLGPALEHFLDVLGKTEIDEAFVRAISDIIDSLAQILDKGGSEGLKTFFDTLVGFFDGVATFIKGMPPGALSTLMKFLGALAALSFIGKFTGLTNLFSAMLMFSPANLKSWGTFAKNLLSLNSLKTAGLIAVFAAMTAAFAADIDDKQKYVDSLIKLATGEASLTETTEALTEDGLGIKNAGNIPGTSIGLGGGGNALGPITELIGFFSPEAKSAIDEFLEGITTTISDWASTDLYEAWKPFWDGLATFINNPLATIKTSLNLAFLWIETHVFQPFQRAGDVLKRAFDGTVKAIGLAWAGLKTKFKEPINWVLDNVWNKGIVAFWNGLADMLNMGNLKLAKAKLIGSSSSGNTGKNSSGGSGGPTKARAAAQGGVLPGFTPGTDVHTFTSPTGGKLKLSGGEAIMRPEWTRMVGGPGAVDRMNKEARSGGKFASGGVYGASKRSFASGGVIGDLLGNIGGFFMDPFKFIKDGLSSIVGGALSGVPGGKFGKLVGGLPKAAIPGLAGYAKKNASASNPDYAYGGGMGWEKQWEAIKAALPWVKMTGRPYRPGDPRSQMHSKGRAIDLTPSMEVFNWIKQNYPQSQALIYSPANGRQLYNGRNYMWGEPERSMHYNHVHWAMANGGVLPKLYDNGGWLQHGQSAVNLSGKPEAVLDPQESRALKALLSGSGLGGLPTAVSRPGVSPAVGNGRVVDNSVNIENLAISNPAQEKVSVSLPKAIRQIAYTNNARG